MELDWSTFILEIVNFLVLIWLLAHFFYKPVMKIIAERKQDIQDTLDKAESMHTEAESLKSQYENRLEDWEKEKAAARDELHVKLDEERKKAMEDLARAVEQQREREKVLVQRERDNTLAEAERQAISQSLSFGARFLERLAGPELEATLVRLVGEDLNHASPEQTGVLQEAYSGSNGRARVTSVWPLDEPGKTTIRTALSNIVGQDLEFDFELDPSLVAGICIDIGSWKVEANIKAELKYFGEMHFHE